MELNYIEQTIHILIENVENHDEREKKEEKDSKKL